MKYLLLAALLSLPGLASRAQTSPALPPDQARLECLYRLTYQPDSTDKTTRTELLRLQLGSRLSRFESKATLFMDSVLNAAVAAADHTPGTNQVADINLNGLSASKFNSNFKEIIYKVPTTAAVVVYDRIGATRYYYQEPPALFSWAISSATATVAGYACQRATTSFGGRTWEAWFTREVPVSDGPYKFYGLPGLIIKISDTRGAYVYELAQLHKLASPVAIILPEAGAKSLSKNDFVQGKAKYERTAFEQLLANGNIRFGTPEQTEAARQKAKARANRKTNPLELK